MAVPPFQLEFYADESGAQPVLKWLKEDLTPTQRRAVGAAMSEILQHLGQGVCETEYGKALGKGLFEFRLRHTAAEVTSRGATRSLAPEQPAPKPGEAILVRVFCHAHGDKLILLLAGYDKGAAPSKKRQDKEVAVARKRLAAWQKSRKS